jgi:glycosyltransferase involved in cell wall biosynthesis
MRIAFSITDLSGGGAARVAAALSNEWCQMGHDVHLITFEDPGTAPFFDVHHGVHRHQLAAPLSRDGTLGFLVTNARRVLRLRRLFKTVKPDLSISFLLEANVASVIAARGLPLRTVVAERNHPGFHHVSRLKGLLRRFFYGWADTVCVQTQEIGDWFSRCLGMDTVVIPNPAPAVSPQPPFAPSDVGRRQRIVGLGRLEPQKGFSRLIEAFSIIAPEHPDWDVVIFGEGAERPALEAQLTRLGLRNRISLPGITDCPGAELRNADLFAHTARYEGYPNAIIEAAAEGLCIVAMDSPGAAREILEDDACGILVTDGDVDDLAAQMSKLMASPDARAAYGARARARAARLSPRMIAQRWIDLAPTTVEAPQ